MARLLLLVRRTCDRPSLFSLICPSLSNRHLLLVREVKRLYSDVGGPGLQKIRTQFTAWGICYYSDTNLIFTEQGRCETYRSMTETISLDEISRIQFPILVRILKFAFRFPENCFDPTNSVRVLHLNLRSLPSRIALARLDRQLFQQPYCPFINHPSRTAMPSSACSVPASLTAPTPFNSPSTRPAPSIATADFVDLNDYPIHLMDDSSGANGNNSRLPPRPVEIPRENASGKLTFVLLLVTHVPKACHELPL